MKKFFFVILFVAVSIVSLTGCSFLKPSFADEPKVAESITVYDANDKEVLRTENKAVLDRFNNRIEGHENTDASSKDIVDLPADAKLAYRMVYSTDQQLETTFLVYKNYDMVTIADLPLVDEFHFEISADFADWLRQPKTWE